MKSEITRHNHRYRGPTSYADMVLFMGQAEYTLTKLYTGIKVVREAVAKNTEHYIVGSGDTRHQTAVTTEVDGISSSRVFTPLNTLKDRLSDIEDTINFLRKNI